MRIPQKSKLKGIKFFLRNKKSKNKKKYELLIFI